MAKICVNCGKRIGMLSNDPFESNGIVLCYDCAKPIRDNLNNLYYLKSKENFFKLKKEILKNSTQLYSDEIVSSVDEKINFIYNQVKEGLSDDITEEDFEFTIEEMGMQKSSCSDKIANQEKCSGDGLYENIGIKIKNLARWIFIIDAIGAVIAGIIMICSAVDIDDIFFIAGMFTMICGPFVAWVSSWIIYAFGDLVHKTSENERHLRDILQTLQKR